MNEPISLIICAHNEEDNLPSLLNSIIPGHQDEIVIVLDRCTDRSEQIVKSFMDRLPISMVSISESEWPDSPKKWAVYQGITHSKNNHLAFTDADCILPPHFFPDFRTLFLTSGIIVGYSLPIIKPQDGFLIQLQFMDALFTAVKYTLFFELKQPYMAVGRNWGFHKDLFQKELLESHANIKSGDDDLLFQQLLRKEPRLSHLFLNVDTKGLKHSWLELLNQKARHYKAGVNYRFKTLLLLGIYDLWVPFFTLLIVISGGLGWVPGLLSGSVLFVGGLLVPIFKGRQILKRLGFPVSSITRISVFALLYHFLLPFFSVFLQLFNPKWKSEKRFSPK
ncbi:MAG: glycosyltransferase [Bacteroidetes bacterium]|nr:glycosyltransferase [Bacteroidota bacterium]